MICKWILCVLWVRSEAFQCCKTTLAQSSSFAETPGHFLPKKETEARSSNAERSFLKVAGLVGSGQISREGTGKTQQIWWKLEMAEQWTVGTLKIPYILPWVFTGRIPGICLLCLPRTLALQGPWKQRNKTFFVAPKHSYRCKKRNCVLRPTLEINESPIEVSAPMNPNETFPPCCVSQEDCQDPSWPRGALRRPSQRPSRWRCRWQRRQRPPRCLPCRPVHQWKLWDGNLELKFLRWLLEWLLEVSGSCWRFGKGVL